MWRLEPTTTRFGLDDALEWNVVRSALGAAPSREGLRGPCGRSGLEAEGILLFSRACATWESQKGAAEMDACSPALL